MIRILFLHHGYVEFGTILISPNEFVNEAMSLKVNSIPQIYSNFLQIKPNRFFVKYLWFQYERRWKNNEELFEELTSVITWTPAKSNPFKEERKQKDKRDDVIE